LPSWYLTLNTQPNLLRSTYNSQIAGYLIREYPGLWTTLDTKGRSLGAMGDDEILVKGTNTPDLRTAVRQVQKAVDQAAIRARQ
jgi:hypothetical protein